MAFAKMNKAVLVTDDGGMHFHAEEVGVCGGDSGVILGFNLNWIVYELKADYRNIYKQSVLICGLKNE